MQKKIKEWHWTVEFLFVCIISAFLPLVIWRRKKNDPSALRKVTLAVKKIEREEQHSYLLLVGR